MNMQGLFGLGSGLIAMCAGSAISIGAIVCPCESPPMGTVTTKSTSPMPGGGSFKLECTNESQYGNFETYYCTPGGDKHHIGTCIYIGGKNWFRYTRDPNTGEVCTITHYNMDNDDHDNPDHQLKVYVYDAKTGMTTETCYKKNPDCTYTPVGTPVCREATEFSPVDGADSLPKFTEFIEQVAATQPQTWVQPGVVVANAVTGSRELTIDTDGVDLEYAPGDVIMLDVPAEYITILDPRFIVSATEDGGAEVTITDDAILNGLIPVARIASSMGSQPIGLLTMSADDGAFQAQIDQVHCTGIALDINESMAVTLNSDMMIDRAPIVADLSGDARVDGQDLALLLGTFGTNGSEGDVDGNGAVDVFDLVELLAAWGASDE